MSEIEYKKAPWRLDDLFTDFDDPEMQQASERLEQKLQAFELFRAELTADLDPVTFKKILAAYEGLSREVSQLFDYSGLRFAADTQDQDAQVNVARYQQMAAEAHNRTLFFDLWWKDLEDKQATRLAAAGGDYRYWLEAMRLEKPYTLSENEEQVVSLKNVNGPAALLTLLSTITDRYTFRLEVDGEEKSLNREELTVYYRHPNPAIREAAFKELFRVYEADKPVLGQIYQFRVRDWGSEFVNLRGYDSPLAVRNMANDVPDEVVDLLLEVSRANVDVFQRYFRLKARWLGMEKLRRYDIYAPVVKSQKKVEFNDAVGIVLSSFQHFDPKIAEMAERVFAEQHYDSEVRQGKQGGAFCATVTPDLTPWILQTYNGRPDDIATMAHELGHAIHSMLADHHTALTQQSSLPLAETASTFGEMLVVDRLLAEEPDPETRRDLLFRQMDTNYATIMRQAYFALFEREAHNQISAGARIDDLTELYAQNLAEQFGEAVSVSDDFSLEWLVIPHIYQVPFYVYAYAFGQLLVLALYQQYLAEGDGFKARYLEILAAGGSDSPSNILSKAGIDIYSRGFWQGGYDVLSKSVQELEELEIPASS